MLTKLPPPSFFFAITYKEIRYNRAFTKPVPKTLTVIYFPYIKAYLILG